MEKPHQHTAWQRFLDVGVLAFLPLTDAHECSIVWSLKPEAARSVIAMSDRDFQQALGKAFEQRLGQIIGSSPRYLFPLQRRQAEQLIQPRLALVGDAIRTVHPLAGQGVNLGLQDVQVLSDLLIQAFRQRRDLGSLRVLNRYARQRQLDSEIMLQGMDGLKNLFGSSLPLLKPLRNLGLRMTHQQPLLKQFLMREAMGL
jgi:2-octaprenylphenol hydroxylase